MFPESEEQRMVTQTRLQGLCDPLGLEVDGFKVTARLEEGKKVTVDASVINMDLLVPCLMYLAHQQGISKGRGDLKQEIAASSAAHQDLFRLTSEEERASHGIHV